jgi:cytochrome c556
MKLRTVTALTLAGLVMAGLAAGTIAQDVDPAIAGMTPEQLVDARQEAMKQNGGIMRNLGNQSGAEAVASLDTMIQNFTNFPALFAEGSIVGDSKALPIIWEEKEAFDAIFNAAKEQAIKARGLAESGDTAGFTQAAQEIGAFCGQCHNKYRAS